MFKKCNLYILHIVHIFNSERNIQIPILFTSCAESCSCKIKPRRNLERRKHLFSYQLPISNSIFLQCKRFTKRFAPFSHGIRCLLSSILYICDSIRIAFCHHIVLGNFEQCHFDLYSNLYSFMFKVKRSDSYLIGQIT